MLMRLPQWIGLLVLCSCLPQARGQFEPVAIDMGIEQDLPDNTFYDAIQDANSYYWLASNEGLFRYNGNQYEQITTPQKNGKAVFGVQLDNAGQVWCNNIYGQFLRYHDDSLSVFIDLKAELGGELAKFYIIDDKLLIFSTKGTIQVSLQDQTYSLVDTQAILNVERHRDVIYAITETGQLLRSQFNDRGQLQYLPLFRQRHSVDFDNIYRPVMATDDKYLYLLNQSEQQRLLRIDHATMQLSSVHFPEPTQLPINRIQIIGDQFWVSTTRGLFRGVIIGRDFHILQQLLRDINVTSVLKDRTDNYLITTLKKGLWLAPNAEVLALRNRPSYITSVEVIDDAHFVIGNATGKLHFYREGQPLRTMQLPNASSISHIYYHKPLQSLYVSTNNRASFRIGWPSLQIEPLGESLAVAKDLEPIDDDHLIYLNYRASSVVDLQRPTALAPPFDESRPFKSVYLPGIRCSYLIGIDGLKVFDRHMRRLAIEPIPTVGTLNDLIRIDERSLWVAYDQALYKISNNRVVDSLLLPQFSNIRRGYSDDSQVLWLSTHEGIVRYDLARDSYHLLNKEDGIVTKTMDMLPFGEHVLLFNAENCYLLPQNSPKLFGSYPLPTPIIREVRVDNAPIVLNGKPIRLQYQQREIKITLGANALLSSQRYRYRYRINSAEDWSYLTQGSYEIVLNSLSHGAYLLEAQVVDSKGRVSRSTIQLDIAILPPFWRARWFLGLILAVFLGGTYLVTQWVLRRATRRRNEEMQRLILDKRLINLQLENLRSQMNPHFIFNALNSVQDFIISNERQMASRFLVKFSKLIRIYLEHGQRSTITLKQEIEALELYLELEKVRFDGKLDYTIDVGGELDTSRLAVPSLMMQPYVENALKHGLMHRRNDRQLLISFQYSDDGEHLLCRIVDNGIGRKAALDLKRQQPRAHQSFATQATDTRVELLNAGRTPQEGHITVQILDLTHSDGRAAGTEVRILIPIQH